MCFVGFVVNEISCCLLAGKIEKEYPLCFPNVGKITIGAVKVSFLELHDDVNDNLTS